MLVANECEFDETIRCYVQRHGTPDYVYAIDLNSVRFMYVATDTLLTFQRKFREYIPNSDQVTTDRIPECLSSAFERTDQERLAQIRGAAGSYQPSPGGSKEQ
jgi:hypothetical protein